MLDNGLSKIQQAFGVGHQVMAVGLVIILDVDVLLSRKNSLELNNISWYLYSNICIR
jgi:hypothetical protein